MNVIILCFKDTNALVKTQLRGFYSTVAVCLQLCRGSSHFRYMHDDKRGVSRKRLGLGKCMSYLISHFHSL